MSHADYYIKPITDEAYLTKILKALRKSNLTTYLICRTLSETGLRPAKALSLTVSEILHFKIIGKNEHGDTIHFTLSPALKKELKMYIKEQELTDSSKVFPQISTALLAFRISSALEKAGIQDVNATAIRKHFFYRAYMDNKMDVTLLCSILKITDGNKKRALKFISCYTETEPKSVKEFYQMCIERLEKLKNTLKEDSSAEEITPLENYHFARLESEIIWLETMSKLNSNSSEQ